MKKTKCYVLMVSRTFPMVHPKAEQETGFVEAIENGSKIHTIRGDFEKWLDIADEVNDGKSYISLRYWSKSPYNNKRDGSKQVEFKRLHKIHVQPVFMTRHWLFEVTLNNQYIYHPEIETLAKNDGLSYDDFDNWMFPPRSKHDEFSGAVIHFTDFKY
ncbi:hypothetical protein [Carboxylicivirga linearis]|uniref:Uncharacterized protein n=1 Tax=Carboxylicivirga linearis TaxID=1628157 RepID=A0ABS5JZW1_9BACT|nr:hypothetical protein [Carboxylicivirga linearis]MBS2100416.1 hypothetical protein [Carboxylicivirga linearis]